MIPQLHPDAFQDQTAAGIVRNDFRTAEVFKKFHLDFCCGGQAPLSELCDAAGVDPDLLYRELAAVSVGNASTPELPTDQWDLGRLIDTVVHDYHIPLRHALTGLAGDMRALHEKHPEKWPGLPEQTALVARLGQLILTANEKEETVVFHYLRQMISLLRQRRSFGGLFVKTLHKPLHAGERDIAEIASLTAELGRRNNGFLQMPAGCLTLSVLWKRLDTFYILQQAHRELEERFLFPKAVDTEQQLLNL